MTPTQSTGARNVSAPVGLRALGFIAFAAILIAPWFAGSFAQHLAIMACLNMIAVTGLAIISRSGQLSFAQAAFVAVGAYVSVLTERELGLNLWLAALLGIVAAAVLAGVLGGIILRLKGVYFVLVTFAFGELMRLSLLDWSGLTGGANGITRIAPIELFGLVLDTRPKFYAFSVAVVLLVLVAFRGVFRRPLGHAIDSIAENPALAESTGLSVFRLQVLAFIVGCGLAALSGVLQARYIGYISPESFNTGVTIGFLIMLVIGGRASVWGPFIGALVMTPLPELFRGAVQTQYVFYGAALILIMRFLPGGLASLWQRYAGRKEKQS
ncbi:branched-chain amino acid ABC transporter permease [Bordetella sp. 02P26C-1]|uniref:branched-chain amino acid ABC transporter permease n=1 Tax=Bordetella sp. 02P26C-1 TaxID=2683195 RepID=UPI001355A583|nr:branched-chain amino acid ABC transporter permease [Bordetella sp. 02P26C-1]MVW77653.1 branched-chain amino acid ABC transporter permease [Bordetella sp. 02P26C-1]